MKIKTDESSVIFIPETEYDAFIIGKLTQKLTNHSVKFLKDKIQSFDVFKEDLIIFLDKAKRNH